MTRKRLLVTGATGAVGTLLRPLLRQKYDLVLTGRKTIEPAEGEVFVGGDITSPDFVDEVTRGRIDGIVHLAGAVSKSLTFDETLDPNYRSVLLLLEACRRKAIDRFIFASSHHIVGMLPSDRQWDETAPIAPDGFYGLSKAFGEAACSMYATKFSIKTMIIRIGNADPQIVDARRERIWISGDDLTALVVEGMESPSLSIAIVNGVSNSDRPLLSRQATKQFRYQPVAHSSSHRAPSFRDFASLTDADGISFVGGLFAADDLPDPAKG
ncbi:NAD(P)-dependent oxidoreductase [Rhizobium lusitanum]|uniref:NAD-dependent epimerase/dehydratase family protein n=1 Tax=Rhizobium lusitanum TaxID=293958 RepID=UPI00195D84D8|nr:NAD(P)-dependent oxidoreductase [Rhizobium lusitanum]MBM7045657.1 NAD(P)-dependent oxidoreductase [Rhizobium lusitanum]